MLFDPLTVAGIAFLLIMICLWLLNYRIDLLMLQINSLRNELDLYNEIDLAGDEDEPTIPGGL